MLKYIYIIYILFKLYDYIYIQIYIYIYTHGMHVLRSRLLESSVKVGKFSENATMMTHQMKAWDERFTM